MIKVNRVGDSITGAINGKQFGIAFSQTKYEKLLELQESADATESVGELKNLHSIASALVSSNFQELIEQYTPYLLQDREKGTYHLKVSDKVVSPIALPKAFVSRVEESVSKGVNITPLVKGFTRMLRNHRLHPDKLRRFANYVNMTFVNNELVNELLEKGFDEKVARERATTFQTPFTREGLLCTYKVSTEIDTKFIRDGEEVKEVSRHDWEVDEFTGLKVYKKSDYVEDRVFQPAVMRDGGDAFVCENIVNNAKHTGHIIRVGCVHYLEHEHQLNSDDSVTGRPGLHVGGLDYIRGFQGPSTETHNVFVDPMDIGAIPDDKTGAIRVKRYFVHSSFAGVNRSIYHSSRFASITDAEFAKFVQEAVAKSKEAYEKEVSVWDGLVNE